MMKQLKECMLPLVMKDVLNSTMPIAVTAMDMETKGLLFWNPNVNIFRDPRWGRGQETFGEDPYLTTRMGVAVVKGMQGPADAEYDKAHACVKHYAVHSGPEAKRHSF